MHWLRLLGHERRGPLADPRRRERNHSKCAEGCLRVDPCADAFEYQNISDTWRNIHNKGDGPPAPDGRAARAAWSFQRHHFGFVVHVHLTPRRI
jgi:hypothetical protein